MLDCGTDKENSNLFKIQHDNPVNSHQLLKSQLIRVNQISDEEEMIKLFSVSTWEQKTEPAILGNERTSFKTYDINFILLS